MSEPLRDWIPVLLFLAASWNGAMLTVFTMILKSFEGRLDRVEKLLMEAK